MAHRPEGRKVKDTDIEVEKVEHFVGKQYRIKEPEKTLEEKDLPPAVKVSDVFNKSVNIISEKRVLLDLKLKHGKCTFFMNKQTVDDNSWILDKGGTLWFKPLKKYVVVDHYEKIKGTLKLVDNNELKEINSGIKLWTFTHDGFIYNKHSNLVFDIKGGMTNVGAPVRLHKLNKSLAQKWRFKLVENSDTNNVLDDILVISGDVSDDIIVDNSSLDLTRYQRNL